MLIQELRQQTQSAHRELDHQVYPYIQRVRSNAEYARLLKAFYGYFQPLYERYDVFLSDRLVEGYSQRRRPEWILDDLRSLGEPAGHIPLCAMTPVIDNPAHSFGSYYVLEGSTMGGSIISKKLSENLGSDKGLRFFSSYNGECETMWNNFLNSMEVNEENQKNSSGLIDSAKETFVKFKDWLAASYE